MSRPAGRAVVAARAAATAGVLLFVVLGWLAGAAPAGAAPADDSPEAGFCRDMTIHHAQAVEMANIIRDRTEDRSLKVLAQDIAITQQGQIGRMAGWLDVWGLSFGSSQPRMGWMHGGKEVDPMPGMATAAEVAELSTLPVPEAEVRFFQLMIRHHEGGVLMADAAIELASDPLVIDLAEKISATQQAEIELMTDLLADRGAEPLPPLAELEVTPGEHHPSSGGKARSGADRVETVREEIPPGLVVLVGVGGVAAGVFGTLLVTNRRRRPATTTAD